jgi:hypothetical protein
MRCPVPDIKPRRQDLLTPQQGLCACRVHVKSLVAADGRWQSQQYAWLGDDGDLSVLKTLLSVIGLATVCVVQAQSPTPAESPAASPAKHRTHKKAEAATSPANPAPAKGTRAAAAANATPAPGGGHGLVWVNTESHVYHKEGSRFYGKTKKGKYVSEADAIKEGDKASKE